MLTDVEIYGAQLFFALCAIGLAIWAYRLPKAPAGGSRCRTRTKQRGRC